MSDLIIENYDEFLAGFVKGTQQLVVESEAALVRLAEDIAAREKASGPRGDHGGKHAIDTIEVTQGQTDSEFFVDVGPSKRGFYLAFSEFGTRHQPPRPFMRPAIAAAISAWKP
jgi:HK97 gp10 family phage protein